MADRAFLAGSGAIWLQPDGPNTQPYYLGCHTLGDVERPQGDASLVFIPDVENSNEFLALDIYKSGGPGPVTTSIQFVMRSAADWLEIVDCPVPIYVHSVGCGRKDVFDNWSRSFILDKTLITSKTATALSVMTPDEQDRSTQSVELAAKSIHSLFQLTTAQQRVVSVSGRTALSVVFSGSRRCYGSCGNVHSKDQDGYMGLEGLVGSPTNVYSTDDGGLIWYPVAGNPFQSWEDVTDLVDVQIGTNSYRVIAARGTIDGLNPMEVGYSDDDGTTWTNQNVGVVNGQFAVGRGNCMHAYNQTNIWLVTTGGYIYFSSNAGLSWTAQTSGGLTVQNLHAVSFADEFVGCAVGEGNTILKTTDGETWEIVTAPALEGGNTAQAVHVFSANKIWVGYDSGRAWFTNDGGLTWFQRAFPGSGTGEIQDIKFCNDYVGYIAHISAGGAVGNIFRTINGGWTWVTQALPSGTGPIYDLHVVNCNNLYAAGEF